MDKNLGQFVKDAVDKALKDRGRINLIIAGKTGIGKSTLINAVFQGDFAETGQGEPITAEIREIRKEQIPLSIIDTRGLELANFQSILEELQRYVETRNSSADGNNHIHAAWLCVMEPGRRVEKAEIELAEMLKRARIPTLGVLTKCLNDDGFKAEVQRLLPSVKNVVRVRSLPERIENGDEVFILPPHGLKTLVEATMELVPEGHRVAFAAAQKVDLEIKIAKSHGAVATAVVAASALAATPIPFVSFSAILPVELSMLAAISAIFGLKLDMAFLGVLLGAAFAATGGQVTRNAIIGGLLKLFPGGQVPGGAMNATAAGAFTLMIGETYIHTLKVLCSNGMEAREIKPEDIGKEFKEQLKQVSFENFLKRKKPKAKDDKEPPVEKN